MANDPIFKSPKGAHDYRRQRLSHHLLSAAPTRHAHASTKMSAMYPNGSVSAVMHGFAPQLSPPRSSSLLQPPVFRAARTARWASSVALFVVAYMRRKPPPRRRHHQRSTCELITAAKITSPAATVICSPSRQAAAWSLSAKARGANPFISHNALAKIIGSQNSIGMARSPCSAGKL